MDRRVPWRVVLRRASRCPSIRQKQPSTKTLLTNQLVVQIVHSGAPRNRTNFVVTIAISRTETASASARM